MLKELGGTDSMRDQNPAFCKGGINHFTMPSFKGQELFERGLILLLTMYPTFDILSVGYK